MRCDWTELPQVPNSTLKFVLRSDRADWCALLTSDGETPKLESEAHVDTTMLIVESTNLHPYRIPHPHSAQP